MKTGMANRNRRLGPMIAMTVLSLGLAAGCADEIDVTLHEPGVYKGSPDPLLAKQKDPAQQEALRERFKQGQRDR